MPTKDDLAHHVDRLVEEKIDAIAADVKDMKSLLIGNGKPGLMVRMDRLEQNDKRRGWIEKSLVGAAILALAAILLEHYINFI